MTVNSCFNLQVIIRDIFHVPVLQNNAEFPRSSKTFFFLHKLCICSLWVSWVLGAIKVVSMAALGSTRNPDIPTLVCWDGRGKERNVEQSRS